MGSVQKLDAMGFSGIDKVFIRKELATGVGTANRSSVLQTVSVDSMAEAELLGLFGHNAVALAAETAAEVADFFLNHGATSGKRCFSYDLPLSVPSQ